MAASISFRFASEAAFEPLSGLAAPASVAAVRQEVLGRRPAAREALHGARNLAASGWKVLFTDAGTKAGACVCPRRPGGTGRLAGVHIHSPARPCVRGVG